MQIWVTKQKEPGTLCSHHTSRGLLKQDHHVRKSQPSILLNPCVTYNGFLCSVPPQPYALSHSPQPANAGLYGKAILGLPALPVTYAPLPMDSSPYAMTDGARSITKALPSYLVLDCDSC